MNTGDKLICLWLILELWFNLNNLLFSPRIVLCPTPDLFKMTLQINSPHLGTEYQVGNGERVFGRDFKFNNLKPFPGRDWFWYCSPYRDVYMYDMYIWRKWYTPNRGPCYVPWAGAGVMARDDHTLPLPSWHFSGLGAPFGCWGCTFYKQKHPSAWQCTSIISCSAGRWLVGWVCFVVTTRQLISLQIWEVSLQQILVLLILI